MFGDLKVVEGNAVTITKRNISNVLCGMLYYAAAHVDHLALVADDEVVENASFMKVTQPNLRDRKTPNITHNNTNNSTTHPLTMSSTPSTEVGCITRILVAFLEETQWSFSSSSTSWICPVSENFTMAPMGTSNSPPSVWSYHTESPCGGGGYWSSSDDTTLVQGRAHKKLRVF